MVIDILIWITIIALFVLSFVGIIYPIIPSPFVIWVGFLLYHFLIDAEELTILFWVAMGILTVVLIGADIIANSYFVKRFGGSKWGERAAGVAVILGSFVIPPFGIIVLPFIVVFTIEMIQKRTTGEAVRASFGSLIGFLSGAAAKVIIQLIMVVWFIMVVIM
ncbi:DUF456 domain-containing protein [Lentibacillus sp. Marseille-P4043]|uniref:DUF456 domain-containing protein n=1 Tax=Lentibacillus sp. Marseille-P4043 TaxID=2040293 RepID=UPI000D0AEAF3|nr:DUF456 family protein [Lentibacillus sp. Marseille-P4043]